jgi:hypothetical protein
MKTYVHFDSRGSIRGVVTMTAPAGVAGGMVQAEPGITVAEVGNLEVAAAGGDEGKVKKLREMLKSHKVKPGSEPRYTLTKEKAR